MGAESEKIAETAPPAPAAFLIPTYKTPLLTSDLLHAAAETKLYDGIPFILLLQALDPHLLAYMATVASVKEAGLQAGYFVFDGTPYCGMVNRVAPIVMTETVCVIDSTHLPTIGTEPFAEGVRKWLGASPQSMRVGTFVEEGFYPLVTRKFVDRLGYLFHPLAYGRIEAENWLLTVADDLGTLSQIENASIMQSGADGVEIVGDSSKEDSDWVDATLVQTLEDEIPRLREFLVT